MTSSQPFLASSPLSPLSTRRRKSRFTFKHLAQLGLSSAQCPLRVIAHIDLDAFYAQCETVRLGISEDRPLAVQQWQGLIAINYPARKFGLNRFVNIGEAQKACPEIILQHVATWKEGDEKWAYHEDAFKQIATHKVSLDPYRLQSRKILALIKRVLPEDLQRVEKASIDEVFIDLSAQVHSIMLERWPEIQGPPPYDDPTEKLPAPPVTALDWNADALIDLDEGHTETDDPDWDDIAMLIGSEVVRKVRAAVRDELKYTCSAGVARNKMLAKLGSAHKKPASQTIIRNRAIRQFLGDFKFTKIRNLGGKLGDEVVAAFNTDTVKDLLEVPLEQLKRKIGDDTGTWIYNTIRGDEASEVNPRTQIKSMLSAKSFRPSINNFEQAARWLRIFVADIFSRLVEEGVLENKRRPKTINLHHRQGGQTRSRQAPIPTGKSIDEALLFELAKNLLAQVIVDGRAWPCANLSLSVGGFEDGVTGNRGIGGFLVRGDEAKAMQTASLKRGESDETGPDAFANGLAKRQRGEPVAGINRFFTTKPHRDELHSVQAGKEVEEDEDAQSEEVGIPASYFGSESAVAIPQPCNFDDLLSGQPTSSVRHTHSVSSPDNQGNDDRQRGSPRPIYTCERCRKSMTAVAQAEHDDWHFARDLQEADRKSLAVRVPGNGAPRTPLPQKPPRGRGRPAASGDINGQSQSRLNFGKGTL